MPEPESDVCEQFNQAVSRICTNVIRAVRENGALESLISPERDSIYIKSADGKILISNPAYVTFFAGDWSPVGRLGTSFLNKTVVPLSAHSDAMILDGCLSVQFDHVGHDTQGREVRMLTHKRSLLGLGHPTMAILGITRALEVLDAQPKPQRTLRELWTEFKQLEELDRNIAIGLARGKNVSTIALENGVTKKTIENHRSAILRRLEFGSPIDLIKLMVRLQENGFGDFGV